MNFPDPTEDFEKQPTLHMRFTDCSMRRTFHKGKQYGNLLVRPYALENKMRQSVMTFFYCTYSNN